MFSGCLGYSYNKVGPNTNYQPFQLMNEGLERIFNFETIKNHVFIIMYGVGSDYPDYCKMTASNIIYEYVNYSSRGLIADLINLKKSAIALKNQTSLNDLFSRERIYRLKTKIKYYLTNKSYNVTLIGVSHGSLIMHGAILKLQMDLTINKENLKRLNILTIGSPRYLPIGLLGSENTILNIPQVLNFYHLKDSYIQKLYTLASKPNSSFRVPNLKQLKKDNFVAQNNIINGPYIYYPTEGIVVVSRDNYPKEGEKISTTNIENYFSPHPSNLSGPINYIPFFRDAFLYHARTFNLYPVMDYLLMFHAQAPNPPNDKNFTQCHLTSTTGGSKYEYLKYNGKSYKIHQEKKTKLNYIKSNGDKIYIKDIRGKYRYIKNLK